MGVKSGKYNVSSLEREEIILNRISVLRLILSGALVGVAIAGVLAKSVGFAGPEVFLDVGGGVFGAFVAGALKVTHVV